MSDAKNFKGSNNPSHGRPDPNPSGDKPAALKIPDPPPTGPKDLKAPSKPSKG
ncbi:MAG TPA: hypothetical protein VH394_14675 [Thermoanaerobaculia bacterium]|jgi:hypothetical protein|nr:hypothetical protein [Thermoanaerobaculia bacterium]